MSFFEQRQRRGASPVLPQPEPSTGPLSGRANSTASLFTTTGTLSNQGPRMSGSLVPTTPRQLFPNTTDAFMEMPTGALEIVPQRPRVVIKGGMKRTPPTPRPISPRRRLQIKVFGLCMLFLVVCLTVFTVTPLGHEIGLGFDPSQFGSKLVNSQNTNQNTLAAQATATYMNQHDGFDPYFNGAQVLSDGSSSLSWPPGQCTYWANFRYHQITGYWVRWNGNADAWVQGARMAGWNVWRTPHLPSIIVMMPGYQSAGPYGHVAIVESINADGSAHTSNMNWGGFSTTRVEYVDFMPGPGIYFIGHS